MSIYKIADSIVEIKGGAPAKVEMFFRKFLLTDITDFGIPDKCIVRFEHVGSDEELKAQKERYLALYSTDESVFYGIRCRELTGEWKYHVIRELPLTEGFLVADKDWKNYVVIDDCRKTGNKSERLLEKNVCRQSTAFDKENEWIELFLTGFYSYATLHTIMMIHASAVKYQDKAILFTAPSGTGKTTQAELWRDFAGAEILNGDRVFIKSTGDEERLYAWGSPWAGSSPYIVNDCAEVAAVVVLEQSQENILRKMDVGEAMMQLSSNAFLPMWDARCLEGMLGVMDLVLRKVPVYKLACRPDEEAVELVRQELFG